MSASYYFKIKRASRDIEIPLCLRATLETFVGGAVIYLYYYNLYF